MADNWIVLISTGQCHDGGMTYDLRDLGLRLKTHEELHRIELDIVAGHCVSTFCGSHLPRMSIFCDEGEVVQFFQMSHTYFF